MTRLACALLLLSPLACDSSSTDSSGSDGTDGTDASTGSGSESSTGGTGTDSGSSTGSAAIDFEDKIQPLLNANCLCHMQDAMGVMEATYLTLNAGMAEANLIDVDAMGAAGVKRVTPGNRADSYLWMKLNGTHVDVGGVGDPMPPLGPLSDPDLELVGAWIDGL